MDALREAMSRAVAEFIGSSSRAAKPGKGTPVDGCGCCRDGIHVVRHAKRRWHNPVALAAVREGKHLVIRALPEPEECAFCLYATDRRVCSACGAEKLRCLDCRATVWTQEERCWSDSTHRVVRKAGLHGSFVQDLEDGPDSMAVPSEEMTHEPRLERERLAWEDRVTVGGLIAEDPEACHIMALAENGMPELVAEVYDDEMQLPA